MKDLVTFILVSTFFIACGNNGEQSPAVKVKGPVTQEQIDSIVSTYTFIYETPMQLDSGTHALIPMSIRTDRGSRLGSSSYYEESSPRFWNVLFMDLLTLETHLLTERKMRIQEIHLYTRDKGPVLSQHVLYTITDQDVNKDGRLDHDDPSHLSISDQAGRELRAVSPINEDLQGWDVLHGHDRIVIRTRPDANGDNKYEVHEPLNVYVYDVGTGQLQRVVTDELQSHVNALFFEQWLKKKD
ncbi:MAG: hypothetical protein M3R08_05145 [Bacteroidota bacterium]|nr:hypothetical protein [Bacteroidota bacterium]